MDTRLTANHMVRLEVEQTSRLAYPSVALYFEPTWHLPSLASMHYIRMSRSRASAERLGGGGLVVAEWRSAPLRKQQLPVTLSFAQTNSYSLSSPPYTLQVFHSATHFLSQEVKRSISQQTLIIEQS